MVKKIENGDKVEQASAGNMRRGFLRKLGEVSAVVPVALVSPSALAGPKIKDKSDCVEVPPENAETFTTTCQYCMVQCGYKVHVWPRGAGRHPKGDYASTLSGEWYSPSFVVPAEKNGKSVYIAVIPDKDCIVNKGDHSVRGGTNAMTLFSKNLPSIKTRLTHPMIRKDGKGSPLTRVSWDEAITFTAKRLSDLKAEHGPDSLALVWGDWLYNLPTYAILKLWFTGIGSSSNVGNGWWFDEESSGVSAALGSGTRSFTEDDFESTKLLVTAGTNIEANGSVWYNRFYMTNLSPGRAKHIDVDPRRTIQAQNAEAHGGLHLPVRPGTDPYLFSAMIREVIRRDAYDKDFVAKNVTGFDVVRDVVNDPRFSLDNAAKVTSVPKDKILRAVDLMIENKGQSMFLAEKGIQHQMAAFESQHSHAVLGLMLGNVGKPGAATSRAGGHPGGTFASPPEPKSREHNLHMYTALEQGKIKSIWAFGSNIFKQMPNLEKFRPLMADTFLVVQNRIHTEMDESADVIFPAATWGETDGVLTSVTRRVRICQQFMDPPGEARPDWWISAQVAKAMGYEGFDWKTAKDVWDEVRKNSGDVSEITWEMLNKAGTNGLRWPYVNGKEGPDRMYSDEYERINGKRFATQDGKVHFEKFAKIRDFDLTKFEWGEVDDKHPLMAYDFRLNELWNTGYTYWDKPTVNARTPEAYVLIHPKDAAQRDIKTGNLVQLKSRYGSGFKAQARVSEDTIEGSVGVPALFPKEGQEFNYVTRPNFSPVNGNFDTMVAVEVTKI